MLTTIDKALQYWKSLSYTTRFSCVAFIISGALGVLSMGGLGLGLYFLVFFLFQSYGNIDNWHGDWIWPAMIGSGVLWSFGFLLAGIAWHYLSKKINSKLFLRIIYIAILWFWAALIWYTIIKTVN